MRKYLKEYLSEVEGIISSDKKVTKQVIENHLIKIEFFKHERLIHLLVTLFYVLFLLISIFLTSTSHLFYIITIILFILLVAYIIHYFYLENGVQRLYKQYDELKRNEKKKD